MKIILLVLILFSSPLYLFSQELMLSKNQLNFLYDTVYNIYSIRSKLDSITVYNRGSEPLLIDSIFTNTWGYQIDISSKDTSFTYFTLLYDGSRVRLSIKSVDSAKFVFHYPLSCTICKKINIVTFNSQITIHSNSLNNPFSYISVQADGSTQVDKDNLALNKFTLYQNYPNPFNPSTTIRVALEFSCNVSLIIFNINGQEITSLFSGRLVKGNYNFTWTTDNMPAGIYFCRMTAGNYFKTIKLILLK